MTAAEIVVCGAGMAGIATAYQLAVRAGVKRVVLIDERGPLGLTSTKGTEAYRNWWPNATLVRFMNRSLELLEGLDRESNGAFELNRRGYVFLTAEDAEAERMAKAADEIRALGASARFERGPAVRYPFVREGVKASLHVERAGWMSARKLGEWLLARAEERGVQVLRDRAAELEAEGGKFRAVRLASGGRVEGGAFILAAGPLLPEWVVRLGVTIPVVNELHGKIAFEDPDGVVPREVPLMIWNDPVVLGAFGRFPAGVHFRPRGAQTILGIWTYDVRLEEPRFPPAFDPRYPEILIRGLAEMIPGLARYIPRAREAIVDGGYYCKTPDNRPLIGPTAIPGVYLIGALSGYGVMSSQASAELVAAHVLGNAPLPDYAGEFAVDRVIDPAAISSAGQL